jgi:hypothetical protein
MNESGKTSILEALAKFNNFDVDEKFTFNATHDYPRKQKKAIDKSGATPDAVTLTFEIDDRLAAKIESDVGAKLSARTFSVIKTYANKRTWVVSLMPNKVFASSKAKLLSCDSKILEDWLSQFGNGTSYDNLLKALSPETDSSETDSTASIDILQALKKYFINQWKTNPIDGYIVNAYLSPNLPKFMYYDDYYLLPSLINLEDVESKKSLDSSEKTANALLELADIDIKKLTDPTEFEDVIAELEATQAIISEELFKYWSTNINLKIQFSIESVEKEVTTNQPVAGQPNTFIKEQIVNHNLNIRVLNQRSGVSLPITNRSKGFKAAGKKNIYNWSQRC